MFVNLRLGLEFDAHRFITLSQLINYSIHFMVSSGTNKGNVTEGNRVMSLKAEQYCKEILIENILQFWRKVLQNQTRENNSDKKGLIRIQDHH